MMYCWRSVPKCLWVASAGGAESIILSAGGTESMMLSDYTESMDTLRAGAKSIILSALPTRVWFSALFYHVITLHYSNSRGNEKKQLAILTIAWRLPIKDFGQQRLNSSANWSAAKGGWVLPHFQQIVSGALMPPCPIAAVF